MASETIDDIVREMRGIKDWRGDDVPIFTDWADRIEAADAAHCDGCKLLVEDVRLINTLKAEVASLRAALKPVLKIEFGDYHTPWTRFVARGKAPETNVLEGVVQTADGYPFSLIGIDFGGLDGLVEIVNAVGESQRIFNESEVK